MNPKILHSYENTLRQYRNQHNLLQKQVAYLLGFEGTDRISQWENGYSLPSVINLAKLCIVYGASFYELYPNLHVTLLNDFKNRKLLVDGSVKTVKRNYSDD